MDASGLVVGVVQSKLDALRSARVTGDIPQNVNFAISLEVLAEFLAKNRVSFRDEVRSEALDTAQVAELAQSFTYRLECKGRSRLATAPAIATPESQLNRPNLSARRACIANENPDETVPFLAFTTATEARAWIDSMSPRIAQRMPDRTLREEFLITVHYEAKVAGIDPQLFLGLIEVLSEFRKYKTSAHGAKGLTQVQEYWVTRIGCDGDNLYNLRTNLRYGAVIFRYFIDLTKGDLFRALNFYHKESDQNGTYLTCNYLI